MNKLFVVTVCSLIALSCIRAATILLPSALRQPTDTALGLGIGAVFTLIVVLLLRWSHRYTGLVCGCLSVESHSLFGGGDLRRTRLASYR